MKQIILFSALAVSVISTAFTPAKIQPLNSNQSVAPAFFNDFSFVRGHRQGKGITLTWGLIANTNLIGFDIVKTNQDPADPYSVWEYAGSVSGSDTRSFKYTDMNVLPGSTHYRITAWFSDSRSSTSDIVTVKIVGH